MKTHFYKICFTLILLGINLLCFTQNFAQEKYLSLNDILVKLTFTSRISTPTEEINKQLIENVKKQKVNFILNEKGEKELKKAGASDLLIKTIQKNLPKSIKKKIEQNKYYPSNLSLNFILSVLNKAGETDKTSNEINDFLTSSVCQNGTIFELNSKTKKALKKAGANAKLFKAVTYKESILDLYNVFVTNYTKPNIEQKKRALSAAKDFIKIAKNNVCKNDMSIYIDYFNSAIPELEKWISAYDPHPHPFPDRDLTLILKFDKAYKNTQKGGDWKKVIETGNRIIERREDLKLDAAILLASVGYNNLAKPNKGNKRYYKKTIQYAKLAINLIEAGESSKWYGIYTHKYKNKENTLGWMNYIIGYVKFHRLNQKYEAVNYFEKAFEYKSEVKKFEHKTNILIHQASYEIFLENYSGSCEQKKIALESVKRIVKPPSGIIYDSQYLNYFRQFIPVIKKQINNMCFEN